MMAGALELVSNRGDAGLSIGSNNNIPVITPFGTGSGNAVQDTANRLMMADHANNVMMFQQKIADRDKLYKALNDGQIVVGDIDPKDRAYYDQAKKAQEDAFYEMAQNGGINNKEAYRKYIQSTTNLAETATHVQARKIGLDQYKKDIAAEPVAAKRKQIEDQYRKQLEKDSGSMIDPYQRSLDFNADELIGGIQKDAIVGSGATPQMVTTSSVRTKETPGKPTVTTKYQKTVPVKGAKGSQPVTVQSTVETSGNIPQTSNIIYKNGLPYNVTQQYVDFNRLKQNANDQYLDKTGEGTELQNQFYDKFTDPNIINHDEIKPTYDFMVKKAQEYNRQRGFTPLPDGSMSAEDLANGAADTKKLINAFNVPPDPQTGKRNINMSKPELASYFALAHMDNYATQNQTLLKDQAELENKQRDQLEKERHNKATEATTAAKNWVTIDKWKTQKKQLTEVDNQAHQKYVDLATAVDPTTGRVDTNKLPASRTFIGGVVYDDKGRAKIGKVLPKKDDLGNTYYDVTYLSKVGKPIKTRSDLPENERTQFEQFSKKYGGTFRDYLKAKSLVGDVLTQFQGSNGVGTANSIAEGENLENIKYGNKGKSPVYNDDNSTPDDENP